MNTASRYTSYSSGGSFETTYPKQIEDILKRNIFCSTCPPWGKVEEVATDGPPKAVEEVRTSLPISLVAIMYAEPPLGWQWSMAIIRDNDTKAQGPFSAGMKIREAKLIEIEKSRIHLDNNGKPEYLDLIDTGPPPAPTPERLRKVRRSMVFASTPGTWRARREWEAAAAVAFLVSSMAGSSDLRGAVVVVDVLARLVAARRALVLGDRRGLLAGGSRGNDCPGRRGPCG